LVWRRPVRLRTLIAGVPIVAHAVRKLTSDVDRAAVMLKKIER